MKRLAAGAVCAVLIAGCGSTVPLSAQSTTAANLQGDLGIPDVVSPSSSTTDTGPLGTLPSDAPAGAISSTTPGSTPTDQITAGPTAPGASVAPVSTAAISVGFLVVKDVGSATKALGYSGLSTGNGTNQVKAAVALLNRRGGINGRQVKAVILEQDATKDADTQYQEACSLFFEDNHVSAVVSWGLAPTVEQCATTHGVPFVTSGNRTTSAAEIAKYPYLALPSQLNLSEVVANLIPSLSKQGYFKGAKPKIGLIYNEDSDYSGVPALVSAALKSLGFSLAISVSMPGVDDTSKVGSATVAGENAVLRFKGAGINRVIAVDKSGQAISYFAIAASTQGFYPSFAVSSLSLPSSLPLVISDRQLSGAMGIGWLPASDVAASAQPSLSSNQKDCLAAMKSAGEDMTSAATQGTALATCDATLLLAAAWKDQAMTGAGFILGLRSLGTSYPPAVTFEDNFEKQVTGVAEFRPLDYSGACKCFVYNGALQGAVK